MRVYKKSGTKERLFEMFENVNKVKLTENYEVIFSDGVKQKDNFNRYDQAIDFVKDKIFSNPKLREIAIYSDTDGFHSTTQEDKLVSWWGDGSYWDNVSKKNPELLNKKLDISDAEKEGNMEESFDSPKEKDEKYLDKTVGTEDSQVSKYDDGTRYPVEKELKVKDPSLEKLKGDDAPIEECADCDDDEPKEYNDGIGDGTPADDQDVADEDEPVNVGDVEPEDNDGDSDVEGGEEEGEIAADMGFEDSIEGGLADDAMPSDFDPEQIAKGIKVEMEHTEDPHKALEIAMDHLTEISDYYDRLEAMEAEAKGDDAEAPEDSLLDPSTHWVDDYSAQNVTDEDINYPSSLVDPEVGEDEYEEHEKYNRGEFEDDENADEMHGINKIEEDNQGSLEDKYEIYVKNADDGNGNDITTGEPLLSFDEWLNN